MTRIKLVFLTAFIVFTASGLAFCRNLETSLSLSVQGAYNFGNQEGYGINGGFAPISYEVVDSSSLQHRADDPGRSINTIWGGVKGMASVEYRVKMPFMQGDGALVAGNNFQILFTGELSPVSTNAAASFTITPVAFLKINTGVKIGSGWYFLFNGLGRNLPGPEYASIQSEPFSGIVYNIWLSSTLQFDFGAVFPGRWNHVIAAFIPKVQYEAFTGADRDTPWQYEADEGENFNGWKLYTTSIIGYRMPLFINTVGVMLDTEQYIDSNKYRSPMRDGGWGSDFITLEFGPFFNFELGDRQNLTVLIQFKNGRDYSDDTIGNRYFEYREFTATYYYFYRIAVSYTVKMK